MEVENDKRISVHEAICAERYQRIEESFERGSKRMQRIEYMLYTLIVLTFVGKDTFMELLPAVIVK